MFQYQTVLVLGAGASVPYGFPTGDGLIDFIITQTQKSFLFYLFQDDFPISHMRSFKRFGRELKEFDPISIDSFLTEHVSDQELKEVGKSLISYSIIKHQEPTAFFRKYQTNAVKDNWYKFLFDTILNNSTADELLNGILKLNIITFNYDLSLEYYLHSRILKSGKFNSPSDAEAFFQKLLSNIIHVYGSIYPYREEPSLLIGSNPDSIYSGISRYAIRANHTLFLEAERLATNIRVIGEDRVRDENTKSQIRNLLSQAQSIYFLGFGFHEDNIRLLDIPNSTKNTLSVYVNSYDGYPKIRRRVEELFERQVNITLQNGERACFIRRPLLIEKKDIYQMLSEDISLTEALPYPVI